MELTSLRSGGTRREMQTLDRVTISSGASAVKSAHAIVGLPKILLCEKWVSRKNGLKSRTQAVTIYPSGTMYPSGMILGEMPETSKSTLLVKLPGLQNSKDKSV